MMVAAVAFMEAVVEVQIVFLALLMAAAAAVAVLVYFQQVLDVYLELITGQVI